MQASIKRRHTHVVWAVCLLSFEAYSASQSDANHPGAPSPLGKIQGKVTDAVTDQGMRKAHVRLRGSDSATTDDEGTFVFENVKPGTYVVEAEHRGYIDGQFGDEDGQTIGIKLAPGQVLQQINVKLTPQAVIAGRVVDEDGDPWTHAAVNLFRSVWQRGGRTLQGFSSGECNDQGEFRVGHIPPGKYYLVAEPDSGWEMKNRQSGKIEGMRQPTWLPSSLDLAGATPIIVSAGSQVSGLEIRLRRGTTHAIRGTLFGLENVPQPDERTGAFGARRISAQSLGAATSSQKGGTIHPDGTFEIIGVPPGNYEINVGQGFPFGSYVHLGSVQVQVNDGDLTGLSIPLIPPRPMKGRIEIAEKGSMSLGGFNIQLHPETDTDMATLGPRAVSRVDGGFDFPALNPARYTVRVQASGFYLREVRYGDAISNRGIISLTGESGNLRLVLSTRGASLTGTVSRGDAIPSSVAKTRVVLLRDGAAAQLAKFDHTGMFAFRDLAPGNYVLYALEGVPEGAWDDPVLIKEIGPGLEIQLSEGDSANVSAPIKSRSSLAPILKRLGME